ncbi:MAG: carbamoyl phosphate synthase small subunit [Ruminococcaceae bacterium]|nr:carbamoyl phosphate synthase small subunit [Oscillospiraceae bacterium]
MKAFLILENGQVFEGQSFGSTRDAVFEMVFNTSMVGYLETMTDPSYAGQGLAMTYPLIGNCGVNKEDWESEKLWAEALIVKELSRFPSNFRAEGDLESLLIEWDIPGIEGIDTRMLTRIIRDQGAMNGVLTCNEDFDLDECIAKAKAYEVSGEVAKTGVQQVTESAESGIKIAVLDLGLKKSLANALRNRGCALDLYPYHTPAETILVSKPQGIFITNGPGNPKECDKLIATVKALCESGIPVFGIGLGHQLIALAMGGDTKRMKYGHHGSSNPVRDLAQDRVSITSQNHVYEVAMDSFKDGIAKMTHVNVNDNSCEGIAYLGTVVSGIQFHPVSSDGPTDTAFVFDSFLASIKEGTQNA